MNLQFCRICDYPINLYLGNYDACNRAELPEGCKILHIWHDNQPGICYKKAMGQEVSFEYLEHTLLTDEQIQLVVDLARSENSLFIHCAAGLGRSPTLCVLALAAIGIPPWDGMSYVAKAMWKQYAIPHCPSFDCKVMNQIFAFYDKLSGQMNNDQLVHS